MKFLNVFKHIFKTKSKKSILDDFHTTKNSNGLSLLCGVGYAEINELDIIITNYPFEPSIAFPNKRFLPKDIDAISIDFGMCTLEIADDIVFISSEYKDKLKLFATRYNIKLIPHRWNWDWILEPYLDTEFTPENEKNTLKRLTDKGFLKEEIEAIRQEVETQMYAYNFDTMLWDWCSLGLHDVLSAMRAKYNPIVFRAFYKKALELDKKGYNL
ncbi:hypothetical protein FNB79_11680 [Formosa sediminum]|uniref:Uncharacterized protein n=1 Tax=Formosa sediminum TaxID=2594004 RepID=A0A516GSU8_9FLAO|nr:DUF5320 domain-containing protein [Formosa sediminum]QDO94596.1 hypothetical protein FNB79_11680 [Formosa sediminum]